MQLVTGEPEGLLHFGIFMGSEHLYILGKFQSQLKALEANFFKNKKKLFIDVKNI